jgi:fibronectin-binding autotransporter adhesin
VISGPGGFNLGSFGTGTAGGTLVLANNNTYTGDTRVSLGILRLTAAGGVANSANIIVGSGATFDVSLVSFTLGASQTLQGSGTVAGNVTANGTIAPGTSAGTLTLNNSLNLASSAVLSFELAGNNTTVGGGVNDLLVVGGNLTLDGTLNVTELGAGSFLSANPGDKWRLINYSGTLTDNGLALGSMPALQSGLFFAVDTATAGQVNLMVVPEPSAAMLGLVGGLGLLVFLRRKR